MGNQSEYIFCPYCGGITIPGIDGLEMIRKSREAGQNIKFIVVSGYREFEYAYQALNFGVEDYILKPVNVLLIRKL